MEKKWEKRAKRIKSAILNGPPLGRLFNLNGF